MVVKVTNIQRVKMMKLKYKLLNYEDLNISIINYLTSYDFKIEIRIL